MCLNKVRAPERSSQPLDLVGNVHGHGNTQTLNFMSLLISNQNSHLKSDKSHEGGNHMIYYDLPSFPHRP